jgi:type IV secretion system protein VirD4
MAARVTPSPFKFGYYYDAEKEKADTNEPQLYGGERHILLFGVNGAGKSTRILIENLVTIKNRSLVIFDMKGELAAQTIRARRLLGDVKLVNPYNVLDMGSDGYNPLALLDPEHDEFFDHAKDLTVAMIESAGENNQFFSQTARGWLCGGIMWEVVEAKREGRPPSLLKAREWCLQPDMWGPGPDGKEVLVKGVTINARRMVTEGGRQIANLAMRFARDQLNRSDQDVLSTLASETEFLISNPIARDLEKGSWSFAQLKQEATAVYVVLPPNQVNDKRRWTRMLITAALCEHLRPGPMKTMFVLDEFRVSIGHLQIVNDFWALVRGYGVQFLPVCQSVLQLRALFKDEWENYAGQAGVVVTIGPPGDTVTAEWMSKRSGNTTIWQEGWSEGEGIGGQGTTTNLGGTLGQAERAFKLPQEIMSMKLGTGRIWPSGHGDISIPFFAPNYWQRRELRGLIDPNPYFEGGAAAPKATARAAASARDRPPFWIMMEAIFVTDRRLDASIKLRRRILRHPVKMARELADIYDWQPKEFLRNRWLRKPRQPPTAGKKLRRGVVAVCILGNLLWVPALLGYDFAATVKAARPWVAEYVPSLLVYLPPPPASAGAYQRGSEARPPARR